MLKSGISLPEDKAEPPQALLGRQRSCLAWGSLGNQVHLFTGELRSSEKGAVYLIAPTLSAFILKPLNEEQKPSCVQILESELLLTPPC